MALKKKFELELTKEQLYNLVDQLRDDSNHLEDMIDDGCFDDDQEEKEHQINRVQDLDDVLEQIRKQE